MLWDAKRIEKTGVCGLAALVLLLLISGCTMLAQSPTTDASTAAPPAQWHDENAHAHGICFEAAWDAADRIFVIRSAEEHVRFYDLADNSRLCRRLIVRVPRDFSNGYVIAGFWSRGVGCTASHRVVDYSRNDDTRTIVMRVMFSTEGLCNYELVRPFWVGFENAASHEITLVVEEAA